VYTLLYDTKNKCKKNRAAPCGQILELSEIFTVKNKKYIFLNLID